MNQSAEFNALQADILKEVGNIGAGHAATALSTLLQDEVRISVTSARMCAFDDISDTVGGPEEVTAGVFLRMTGDLDGNMMLLLTLKSAKHLTCRLLEIEGDVEDFTELEMSVLAEVGNILGGSYTNAISALTGMRLNQTVPAVAVDMAGAILDIGILMAGEASEAAILIDTCITQGEAEIEGHFFMLPDPGSMIPLLRALGCHYE
jgi:chemotaxis protein CheC